MKTPIRMLAFGAALTLVACGGTSNPTPSASGGPSVQASIASEVPADIKGKKAIQVGVDATYAPNESIDPDTGHIIGWDIDLGNAIGAVIGVPMVWNNADFNSIIP